jgi:hypothetical protein
VTGGKIDSLIELNRTSLLHLHVRSFVQGVTAPEFPSLVSLRVYLSDWGGIQFLAHHASQLQELDVDFTNYSPVWESQLQQLRLPRLRRLITRGTKEKGLLQAVLDSSPAGCQIDVHVARTPVRPAFMPYLVSCADGWDDPGLLRYPRLRSFFTDSTRSWIKVDDVLNALREHGSQLTELKWNSFHPQWAYVLPLLTNLRKLSLSSKAPFASKLADVFPSVKHLVITGASVSFTDLSTLLSCFPSLRVLQINVSNYGPLIQMLQLAQQRGVEEMFVDRSVAKMSPDLFRWMEYHR